MPLEKPAAEQLLGELNGWSLSSDGKNISKEFKFKNFVQAIGFANTITPIAEAEGHHPNLFVSWGKVKVELSTHAIGGLSENDFILAAKIDSIA